MSEALITVKNAAIVYEDRLLCSELDFEVSDGMCLAIVGGGGSGKSTLLRVLYGLEKPVRGSIEYLPGLTRREMGFLPQISQVRGNLTVRDVVLSGCLNRGRLPFFTKADRQILSERLRLVGIEDIASRKFAGLSGGMRQKVLLARALCAAKKLLFLDEPTYGLDRQTAADIRELAGTIAMAGMPVVFTSADTESVLSLATHVLHLSDTPLFFGALDEYLKTPVGRFFEAGRII